MSITVRAMATDDSGRWDDFVQSNPDSTFFHRAAWGQVLETAFGHRPHFLLAEQEGRVIGILPLAQVKSALFGNSLASLPFCVYGGIVAESAEAASALRASACELAESLKVDALELRNRQQSGADWPVKDLYFTFRGQIDPDNEVNLKAIPNRQRAMIRKAQKEDLVSEETTDSNRLYRVYSESVRNLGTPIFSRKYFSILQSTFKEDCRILMIRQGAEDVAGVMSFYFKGDVLPYYGGSIARARAIKGCNHFMYWELLRRSADEGLTGFDFGRSKAGTGPYQFKKNWGYKPEPLPYEYHLVRAREMPNLSPNNPKYRLLVNTWSRLPLSVANFVGPFLARNLG